MSLAGADLPEPTLAAVDTASPVDGPPTGRFRAPGAVDASDVDGRSPSGTAGVRPPPAAGADDRSGSDVDDPSASDVDGRSVSAPGAGPGVDGAPGSGVDDMVGSDVDGAPRSGVDDMVGSDMDGAPRSGVDGAPGFDVGGAVGSDVDDVVGSGVDGRAEPVVLPEPVRVRVVGLAADALGRMSPEDVPATLRAAARFAPAKRARSTTTATAIATVLDSDAAFRLSVAGAAEQESPLALAAVRAGETPPAADPVELAAAAYLLRVESWPSYVERARAALDEAGALARAREHSDELDRLRVELAALRAGVRADVQRAQATAEAARGEVEALRRQLREQTGLRRAAERARTTADEALAAERRRAAAAESAGSAEIRRLRQRVAEAEDAVEAARRAARESRQADETRLWLLLDTVSGAVRGLRRELALSPTDERPADAIPTVAPRQDVPGARGDDPELLDRLLELPRVHLVVDGYNVTKSGYGDLPLAAQRGRLVQGLGALAARTGAEVSCVFDGAARPPVAPPAPRGVRVLFSAAGELADDLIRRLVAAEPEGRPVVVVSSDREVADGVRSSGAYPVPSTLLLRRLDRG